MGIFAVNIELGPPAHEPVLHGVEGLMVDTGSEMTWVAAVTLREAGIRVRKKDQLFLMANGETVKRDVGYAVIRSGEFETIDEVVFAQVDDLQLLGARTLEGFNGVVDPPRKRLVAAGPMPAAVTASLCSAVTVESEPLGAVHRAAPRRYGRSRRGLPGARSD